MKSANVVYREYTDETGEAYYCPLENITKNGLVTEKEAEHCVEASTVGRYSGNLTIADRFTS